MSVRSGECGGGGPRGSGLRGWSYRPHIYADGMYMRAAWIKIVVLE